MATLGNAVAYALKCAGKAELELKKEQLEALITDHVTLLRRRRVSAAGEKSHNDLLLSGKYSLLFAAPEVIVQE